MLFSNNDDCDVSLMPPSWRNCSITNCPFDGDLYEQEDSPKIDSLKRIPDDTTNAL